MNISPLCPPLNILVNNAGINAPPFTLSEDGIEQQFVVNHLGPFLLTNLLLDTMKNTATNSGIEGRIVNVGSALHAYGYKEGIRLDRINDQEGYDPTDVYGQSKLCTILHTLELPRHLKEEGVNITANSLHPGIVATNMRNHGTVSMLEEFIPLKRTCDEAEKKETENENEKESRDKKNRMSSVQLWNHSNNQSSQFNHQPKQTTAMETNKILHKEFVQENGGMVDHRYATCESYKAGRASKGQAAFQVVATKTEEAPL